MENELRKRENELGVTLLFSGPDLCQFDGPYAEITRAIRSFIERTMPEYKKIGFTLDEVTCYFTPNGKHPR